MAWKVVLRIEEASFFFSMSVHRLNMFILLGERAVGPRRCWRMGEGGGVGIDGFAELDCPACVSGATWLGFACLLACWGGINVSLWWGGVWGVVWLDCGMGCAGRHGGAPARPYVGASHTPDDDLA